MSAGVLASGSALFGCALALHWAAWRAFGPPRRHVPALLIVFAAPAAAYALWQWPLRPSVDLAAALLLHAALACAYMQTYPAAQARSPSLEIILRVAESGSAGLTRQRLVEIFDARGLLRDRVDDLLAAGLIETAGDGRLSITARGRILVPPFLALRRILGLPVGRG